MDQLKRAMICVVVDDPNEVATLALGSRNGELSSHSSQRMKAAAAA